MYFITTKRMLEVCFSAHPNIQYRTDIFKCVEACASGQGTQYGHQYVIDKGSHNLAESAADNDAHGHVDDVSFEDKCLEFFHYAVNVTHW